MNEQYIWTMWWQGEENAPVLVKKCIDSMRKKSNGRKVVVITEQNYLQYIELPKYILEKMKRGVIDITHFSDLVRMELIYKYGGIWIDSTVFISYEIPSEIYELDFYTIKRKDNFSYMNRNISRARWSSYLIGGKKGCRICGLMKLLFYNYWKEENIVITYFLMDYFLDAIIRQDMKAKKLLDAVPYYEKDIFLMNEIMNKTKWKGMEEKIGIFSKLSWKEEYSYQNENGEKTFFGVWIDDYISDGFQLQKLQKKEMKLSKMKRYFNESFNKLKIESFGMKLCIYSFCNLCIQSKHGRMADFFNKKYNDTVRDYLMKYSRRLNDIPKSL